MKAVKLFIAALFLVVKMFGQSSDNLGFEFGNFDNWTGYRGFCCGGGLTNIGIANGWHTLMTQQGYDSNSNNTISYIAPGGGNYSVRLGNANAGAESERLKTTFMVTAANANLTYMYAVLLQDPPGHSVTEKPKFEIRILDYNGNQIPGDCGHYEVIAGLNTAGWKTKGEISYKNWSSVAVDLRSYIGSQITLEFTTQDCGQDGHFGYAYIDVVMSSFNIVVTNFCQKTDKISLIAPPGFVQYRWLPGGETGQTLVINNPVSGDTFMVELTNESGCITILKHILIVYPYPVVSVCKDTTICAGRCIGLNAYASGSGIIYDWTSNGYGFNSNQQSPLVCPKYTTIYSVKAKNPNGCYDAGSIAQVKVTVRNHLVFDLHFHGKACPNDSIILTSPIITQHYKWYSVPSSTTSTNRSFHFATPTSAVYYLEISDSLCSYQDTIAINIPKDYVDINFCEHDSVIHLSSPYTAMSYLWSKTGDTKSWTSINNAQNNEIIYLYMTGTSGCFSTYKYYLKKNYDPYAIAPPDASICAGTELMLTGNGAGSDGEYMWQSIPPFYTIRGKNIYISPYSSIQMVLNTTTKAGCKAHLSDTVKVNVKTDALFSLPSAITACFGEYITLSPHVRNGLFKWTSTPAGYMSLDSVIKVKPLKNITYTLFHSANGCSYINSTAIDFFRRPDIKIVDYCMNDTQVVLTADNQYTSFDWVLTKDTTQTVIVKPPFKSKYFPMHYTIAGGCSDTVFYYMNRIRNPIIHAPNDTVICIGTPVEVNLTGIRSGFHYYWTSDSGVFISDKKTPVFYPDKTTWYKVKVTNEIGCFGKESIDSLKVSLDTAVLTELGNDTFICKGQTVKIKPLKGSGFYMWSSYPSGFSSTARTISVKPNITTRYYLQMKDYKCTGNVADLIVHLWDLPQVDAGSDRKICTDGKAFLSVNKFPGASFKWTAYKSTFIDTNSYVFVKPEKTTIYFIKITDENNCVNYDTVWVRVYSYPKVDLGDTLYICDKMPFYLNVYSPGCQYDWNTGETVPSINIKESGNYSVSVNNNGCVTKDDVEIIYRLRNDTLNIPNIFTPNNDGVNDQYKVTVNNYDFFELTIYNRWGEELFKTYDPDKTWTGLAGNKPVSSGVYFYTLRIQMNCENLKTYAGSLTVIK
jgi:gliding motility-associated-like protein